MKLVDYIEQNYSSKKNKFAKDFGLTNETLNKMLKSDYVVYGNTIYEFSRKIDIIVLGGYQNLKQHVNRNHKNKTDFADKAGIGSNISRANLSNYVIYRNKIYFKTKYKVYKDN